MENYSLENNPSHSKNKIIIILTGLAMMILTAPIPEIFGENSSINLATYYLSAIALNCLVFAWCHYDSLQRNFSFGGGWRIALILFGVFALLVYFFKSRGFVKGLAAVGYVLLLVVVMFIGSILTITVANLIVS